MTSMIRVTDDAIVISAWLDTQSSANTRAAYSADLQTFGRWCAQCGALPLRADSATIAAFHAARAAAGDSASTLRRRLSSLSSFYRFAVDLRAVETNPVTEAPRPQPDALGPSPTAVLSADAVEEYLAVAAALDPRLEALVALLVRDGLKLGEALAIDVDDIRGRLPRVSLMLRRNGVTKTIILSRDSARAVLRCGGQRSGEPLFTRGRASRGRSAGGPSHRLTRFGADHLIRKLGADDESRVTANALRRFHVTSSHATGTDLDAIRDRAGLADVRGVQRYLIDDPDSDRSLTADSDQVS